MTVFYKTNYSLSKFGSLKVLFKWKGSIYKLVWPHVLQFTLMFFAISYFYRLTFTKIQKSWFVKFCHYFNKSLSNIPLSFMLGFYTNVIAERWYEQAKCLPMIDDIAVSFSINLNLVMVVGHGLVYFSQRLKLSPLMQILTNIYVRGDDYRGRLIRRNIIRYLNLSTVLTLTMISYPVKARFPTLEHLVAAGLLFPHEKVLLDQFDIHHPDLGLYWVPLTWCKCLIERARREDRIETDNGRSELIQELFEYRGYLGGMLGYDWINVPLIYSQLVTVATYAFFCFSLIGLQFIQQTEVDAILNSTAPIGTHNHSINAPHILQRSHVISKYSFNQQEVDFYFPFFLFFEFFFFMGWLKVGETLLNPFGEDDDDFEINWIIDRNFQVSNLIVDDFHDWIPKLERDPYFDTTFPDLPYNSASSQYKKGPYFGSAEQVHVPENLSQFIPSKEVEKLFKKKMKKQPFHF